MDEGQRARLRRLVADMTDDGAHVAGLPRHKTGLVERLREQGRHEEANLIENGAGSSLYAGDAGVVVWIISGARRERLFDEVKRGDRAAPESGAREGEHPAEGEAKSGDE